MSVVTLFLDGFSSRYMVRGLAPAICRLASMGSYSEFSPVFGFQRVGATIFSGCGMHKHGLWTDYVFNPENPRRSPNTLLSISDILGRVFGEIVPKSARFITETVNTGAFPTANCIPPHIWPYVRPALMNELTADSALAVPTIFDLIRKCDLRFSTPGLAGRHDEPSPQEIRSLIESKSRPELLLIKLGLLDRIGHKHGPTSTEMEEAVRHVDGVVDRTAHSLRISKNPAQLIIFSDHGMTPVTSSFDIESELYGLKATPVKDFLYYLNSTVASFFFKNEKTREEVTAFLEDVNHGHTLTSSDWGRLGGAPPMPYGHLHFALDEGSSFFPDFYQRKALPKGLHGYAFSEYDRPIFVAAPGFAEDIPRTTKFENLAPTIASSLSLDPELQWEGRSLL